MSPKERGKFMSIKDYRASLGWSLSELARRSGLTYQTVSRIEKGEAAYLHTVGAIARAFSEALGKTITVNDLDGVKIIS
jgi:transcriptional regulator with XRE-family HTH domain